jgi:hypothetical protein
MHAYRSWASTIFAFSVVMIMLINLDFSSHAKEWLIRTESTQNEKGERVDWRYTDKSKKISTRNLFWSWKSRR